MVYKVEESLSNFEFWSGAKSFADRLTSDEFDAIESMLEDIAPEEGYTDTAINDIFWFEQDMLLDWIGVSEDEFNERICL